MQALTPICPSPNLNYNIFTMNLSKFVLCSFSSAIQFYSKPFLQVLTHQLLGQVEEAQMWTEKLKSYLESMQGISQTKKVHTNTGAIGGR